MNATSNSTVAAPRARSRADIADWRPEDNEFWERTGKKIANRNLALSIPDLLCAFAVWVMWGIITVQMLNLGFPFKPSRTVHADGHRRDCRAPRCASRPRSSSALSGGRNTVFLTRRCCSRRRSGTGIALQDKDGRCGCSRLMRVPVGHRRRQLRELDVEHQHVLPEAAAGHGARLNAGIGNFGVTTMQILIPLVMTAGLFGALGGELDDAGEGQRLDPRQDPGRHADLHPERRLRWALSLVPLSIAAWFGMNNLLDGHARTTAARRPRHSARSSISTAWPSSVDRLGLYLYLPKPAGLGLSACGWPAARSSPRGRGDAARRVRSECGATSTSSSRSSATSTPGR